MAIIKKKIPPEYFDLISSGKKRFEARLADFEAKEGDVLVLEEYDTATKRYTGRKIEKTIDYVLKFNLDLFGQKQEIIDNGLLIMQLK